VKKQDNNEKKEKTWLKQHRLTSVLKQAGIVTGLFKQFFAAQSANAYLYALKNLR